ncbi:ectoine/hydroxyectoine ABC transporter substrate-binding protein EhuB [Mesorhizobium carmichaelinearum]|uniref:ectoine/hydroxyectoine ABC transporter substrate-binding protein EhuB n=1 Tax=Mesorhizobium carmichaelinearum TaxID=1208188 RepID=UPI000BA36C51|nr:ectoine/hydroxyectoine ABC transporter substrate-binding protein EhuB [Mesorhizobium carmichaelinearum]
MLYNMNDFRRGAALAAALILTSMSSAGAATSFEKAKESGTVEVGIANEKPYGYLETDGSVNGVIIDVLRAVLKPIGIDKIKGNVSEFSALIPAINARRFDVLGAGMAITPKRCEAIAFSNPFTRIANVLAAKTGNPNKIHSLEDIAASKSLKVGSQVGASQVADLHRVGIPEDRIVLFARDTEAIAGLKAGRVDAIYYPALEVSELIKKFGESEVERVQPFTIAKDDKGKPLYVFQAFGFNKADSDFVAAVNDGIKNLSASGKLLEILAPYGFTKDDLPDASVTAEGLCSGS